VIVIICKIVNSSVKFKFIHKVDVIHKKFLLLFNLLHGPDIASPGQDPVRGLCIPDIVLFLTVT